MCVCVCVWGGVQGEFPSVEDMAVVERALQDMRSLVRELQQQVSQEVERRRREQEEEENRRKQAELQAQQEQEKKNAALSAKEKAKKKGTEAGELSSTSFGYFVDHHVACT